MAMTRSELRVKKRETFHRLSNIFQKHDIIREPLDLNDVKRPEVRGLRGILHAIWETSMGYSTYPHEDINALISAAERNPDFASTLFLVAKRYGLLIPESAPNPENYIEKVAEQPRWTRTLYEPVKKRKTGTKLGDLKLQMIVDLENILRRAYQNVEMIGTQKQEKKRLHP